jgi:hypothetical protein
MKMNRMLSAVFVSLSLTAPLLAFADIVTLKAELLAFSEAPPGARDGRGTLTATRNTSSKVLRLIVTYADLTGPASMQISVVWLHWRGRGPHHSD